MKNFDANQDTGGPLHCVACEREIPDGTWFARIKVGDHRVALCGPRCVERLLDDPDRYAWRFTKGREISTIGVGS